MSRASLTLALLSCLPAVAQQTTFEFRSNFWVNLHHFLYQQASSKSPEPSDSPEWQHAIEVYRNDIVTHELLSNDIAGINASLAQVESAESLNGSGIDAELTQTLERAAPVYKARWWPEHNRKNVEWIAVVTPLVVKYEAVMKKELSSAYQTPWPADKIRTDVSKYASWAGAYTLLDPTLITISSKEPVTQTAVETLFHEASHAMIQKVSDAIDTELDAQKKVFKKRAFWHAVLFYTAGEIAQRHLDDYTMFGVKDGIFERAWPGALPVLEKDWKPYLDGKIDLATGARRLVEDYGVAK